MKIEGIQPVGYGALLGIIITSVVAVIAQFVKRDTTLRSHMIDDRGKVTADTDVQLARALARQDKAEEHINLLTNDKNVLVNTLQSINAGLILLEGLFDQQEEEMCSEIIDFKAVLRKNVLIKEGVARMRLRVKESETVYYRNSIPPPTQAQEKILESVKK